jgi:hypothetical protein
MENNEEETTETAVYSLTGIWEGEGQYTSFDPVLRDWKIILTFHNDTEFTQYSYWKRITETEWENLGHEKLEGKYEKKNEKITYDIDGAIFSSIPYCFKDINTLLTSGCFHNVGAELKRK